MSKQIHFAGVSRVNGVLTFRTAGSPARAQQLAKLGDTDIDMVMLRGENTTKSQAAKRLLEMNFSEDAEILALLTSVVADENPFAKPKKVAKPKAVKKTKTVVAKNVTVKATAPVVEDRPFSPREAAKIRAEFMKKLKIAYEAN
jgi:hypothetical protein